MMNKKGYTLVEMLVVVALLSIVGVGTVGMFLSTARGGGKAGGIARVKEEGDYAITTMERYIHFATTITLCNASQIDFTRKNASGTDEVVTFSYDPATFQIRRDGVAITSQEVKVDPFTFDCPVADNGVRTVNIDFGMEDVKGEAVKENFHSKVVLRNITR